MELHNKQGNILFANLRKAYSNKNMGFNFDIANPHAEMIVVLQLVDDTKNNGSRRNNILNGTFNTLGISIKKAKGTGNHYSYYLTFSN